MLFIVVVDLLVVVCRVLVWLFCLFVVYCMWLLRVSCVFFGVVLLRVVGVVRCSSWFVVGWLLLCVDCCCCVLCVVVVVVCVCPRVFLLVGVNCGCAFVCRGCLVVVCLLLLSIVYYGVLCCCVWPHVCCCL